MYQRRGFDTYLGGLVRVFSEYSQTTIYITKSHEREREGKYRKWQHSISSFGSFLLNFSARQDLSAGGLGVCVGGEGEGRGRIGGGGGGGLVPSNNVCYLYW